MYDIQIKNGHISCVKPLCLTSSRIEDELKLIKYSGNGRINDPVIENMHLPSFTRTFLRCIWFLDKLPTPYELYENYKYSYFDQRKSRLFIKDKYNKKYPRANNLIDNHVYYRLLRYYPSIVRDIHFMLRCYESNLFKDVNYSYKMDCEEGIDILINNNNRFFGVRLFINTPRSNHYNSKKNKRHSGFTDRFTILDFPVDFKKCKKIGDYFLLDKFYLNYLQKRTGGLNEREN